MRIATQRRVTEDYPELPIGHSVYSQDPVFEATQPVVQMPMPSMMPGAAAITEDFGAQLHDAQEKLLELRQQQELIERQRAELEELRAKQERFLKGRVDVVERLSKGLTRLDRDTFQTRKRLEMLDHAKQNFTRHLDSIESLNPEHWSRADLRNELVRATAAVEDAEQDYIEAMGRLGMSGQSIEPGEALAAPVPGFAAIDWPGFRYWLTVGCAIALPVALLGLLFMIAQRFLS